MAEAVPSQITVAKADFLDDLPKFMEGKAVEPVITSFEEQRRKFKLIEQQFVQRKARLMMKQPEIQKALDIVKMLLEKEEQAEMIMDYELAEGVYSKAKLAGVKTVNLWLGAGIMVEYSLKDAKVRASVDGDIETIRDNITTLDVSLSRVWNFDVERRRLEREKGEKGEAQ
ncbi:prefoldin chaperone 1 [Dunaliella salina]|uniref:Prefoldin chaperone 1 n=1 Tax=Dunaliella salina TaxID=3046 RepID=A0ABQ7GUY8_DUNSA|nr:prefoldin chaperone 1 [Dunaliella salina]|eukprot:KAF5838423.1 prefoldin chaperone 1 [Dunaliella salina]